MTDSRAVRARVTWWWLLAASLAHASPPLPPAPPVPAPMTHSSTPRLRVRLEAPQCQGLELLLYEVRLVEGPAVAAPRRSAARHEAGLDELRVTFLAVLPERCDQVPRAVLFSPVSDVELPLRGATNQPTRVVEFSTPVVTGTTRLSFGWQREAMRVSLDLVSGEARLEVDGTTVASAGAFREVAPQRPAAYVRHPLGVRLSGVRAPPRAGPNGGCVAYFDLALDDAFVVRRAFVRGAVYDELVLEAGFLRAEQRPSAECAARNPGELVVHLEVEPDFSLESAPLTRPYWAALGLSGGDRVVRRFQLPPGTKSARLVFSPLDAVDVELDTGKATLVRAAPPFEAPAAGLHDVRALWESRERDRPGYLRATFLRAHPGIQGDPCTALRMSLEPVYAPGGEAEALWEVHRALGCDPPLARAQ